MSELTNKNILTLFPSQLYKSTVSDLSMCSDIAKKLIHLRDTTEGTLDSYGGFTTTDQLQHEPEFLELARLIWEEAGEILDVQSVVRDSHYITSMWGNVNPPNHMHMMHVHPNSYLSGLIYINAPEDCGFTVFGDPRPGARMFEPNYNKVSVATSGAFLFPPKTGTMLFWNSWLPHGVERGNNTTDDRIVVAFNIMIKGKITTRTAPLVL
jgi:uncharacterized protein (TIGR02466 family)